MSLLLSSATVQLFRPPYDRFEKYDPALTAVPGALPGAALIWWIVDAERQQDEFDALRDRPYELPLLILLPPPREIGRTLPLINVIGTLHPRAVLPVGAFGAAEHLRHVLAAPPPALAEAAVEHLRRRGVLPNRTVRREVHRILELAPEVPSISKLARRMYTSRRTLGRHFAAAKLPVPSHWLQFARLLHLTIHLQNESTAVFRLAARAGYPDGFTMSNQMKRLIGYRPTEVRQFLGWEWVVEAWLRREGVV
jgi:AraC-like DNA-binding protein